MTTILGISCYYHDSAACLLENGKIAAAAHEERFTRVKHDKRFPINAIKYCLDFQQIEGKNIDYVVYYEKPIVSFDRVLTTFFSIAPKGADFWLNSVPGFLKQRFVLEKTLKQAIGYAGDVLYTEHHEAHAAAAFYPSPFENAAVLTVDGVGEWATATISHGRGSALEMLRQMDFPDSVGLLYSAFTSFLGFKVNSGEYKIMGLAPYGRPVFKEKILDSLLDLNTDGSIHLNMEYFDFLHGNQMVNDQFGKLFGMVPRKPEGMIQQNHSDLAASIQAVVNEILLQMSRYARQITGEQNLCMAGGVALNCVANSVVLKANIFKNIWIQPASGDAGGAVGAAYAAFHRLLGHERKISEPMSCSLGPEYDDHAVLNFLKTNSISSYHKEEQGKYKKIARLIDSDNVVGYMNGRMEFGPRALGNRSILADPRNIKTQRLLNQKIKFRESFRPFAPAVVEEMAGTYFDLGVSSPYMLFISQVVKSRCTEQVRNPTDDIQTQLSLPRSDIPAVTHVDYSARIQTVDEKMNQDFYRVLKAFHDQTGCAVLANTSFNVRGEPIVCTPEDSYRCFMNTDMDVLVMGNYFLLKTEQKSLPIDWNLSAADLKTSDVKKMSLLPMVFLLVCLSVAVYLGSPAMVLVFLVFFVLNGCIYFWPVYFSGLHRFLNMITQKIQTILSRAILGLTFYAVILPVGLIRRILKKDLLSRHKSQKGYTSWKPQKGFQDKNRFYKQY